MPSEGKRGTVKVPEAVLEAAREAAARFSRCPEPEELRKAELEAALDQFREELLSGEATDVMLTTLRDLGWTPLNRRELHEGRVAALNSVLGEPRD